MSKRLATIEIHADIDFSYEEAKLGVLFTPEAYEIFKRLAFKNMLSRFEHQGAGQQKQIEKEPKITEIRTKQELEEVVGEALKCGSAAIRFIDIDEQNEGALSENKNGQMVWQFGGSKGHFGCLLYSKAAEETVFFVENENELTKEEIQLQLARLIDAEHMTIGCFDIKNDYQSLLTNVCQFDTTRSSHILTKNIFDCKIAAYLLNPLKNNYEIADIAGEYLNGVVKSWHEVFGKSDMANAYATDKGGLIRHLAQETFVLENAAGILAQALEQNGMLKLFRKLEMPLTYVLYDMEREGILVKPEELKAYGEALMGRIGELERNIHEAAGETFNINSPKQLGEILFEKLKLPEGKKTKTGYSTAADVLEKLAPQYPIVSDILEYRGLTKLKSTYADGLAAFIDEDNKIHTSFHQTITATGRLSSTEPNLQNIPMRMELGRRIRKVFVPQEGCLFMDADYSQIELRVLAHMSGDAQLIEAYQMDEDIHRITASKVFHTPFEEVTDLQRRNAKAVNFGIVYGISSFGLSQDLSISPKEAKVYIDEYFKTYPNIKGFLDQLVSDAKEKGYCETMFGRRRPVPELKSSNFMQRSFGERVAMNSPIQGTAADIIKIAMVNVYDALRKKELKSKLILQIHDELLIETRQDEVEAVRTVLTEEMQNACSLAVKLETDLHTGSDWYEAK